MSLRMKTAAKHVAKAYLPLQVRDFGYGEVGLASSTGKNRFGENT